ncbi:bifunctional DNA-formamidopyrimidine glycosylase/DNA-(apurinic or apyrimidinic site) lyase [Candidatus Falkowbacteria bacterium]|nr:bifunctional DNA-formamidopyrimidine glycosylase/DNA-(apurinic or apyrimidinic site) lyase [Candidatus Falkowbacteria bacterium]
MPELPEVETIRRQLLARIRGRKIKSVEVKLARMVNVPAAEFEKTVANASVKNIRRRAKILIFDLSNGWSIAVHLKMTGQLIYDGKEGIGKSHIIYTFSDGHKLKHYDFRLFGYAKLIKTDEMEKLLAKENFGPEILDGNFSLVIFKNLLAKKPRAKIKPLLMDQKFIAGVGNIYAQEACFCARISPKRIVGTLAAEEIKNLYQCLQKILAAALARGGSSVDAYVNALGEKGGYVPFLKVYGREGKPCIGCRGKVKTIKLAGRGTSFCPSCQR